MRGRCVVIGAGPAGLMAAEAIAGAGRSVVVHDASPSPGRKFLLAGRGGLNLTHSEPLQAFLEHYGLAADRLLPAIQAFPPDQASRLGRGSRRRCVCRLEWASLSEKFQIRRHYSAPWLRRLDGLGVAFVPPLPLFGV